MFATALAVTSRYSCPVQAFTITTSTLVTTRPFGHYLPCSTRQSLLMKKYLPVMFLFLALLLESTKLWQMEPLFRTLVVALQRFESVMMSCKVEKNPINPMI